MKFSPEGSAGRTDLIKIREVSCKSALGKTGIPGFDYALNPYGGCSHACVYCYASFVCRFAQHPEPWGEFVDVKVNFPEILSRQLFRSRKPPRGRVLLGTVTDAYQPAEARYRLTRSSLEILAGYPLLEVQVLTKSDLILRDLSILRRLPGFEAGFTINTLDRRLSDVLEPGAPSPDRRLAAAWELIEAKIPVWVFIAPLLPGLTDTRESLSSLVRALREAGIRDIQADALNPYPAVTRRLREVYAQHFPEALPELEESLRDRPRYRKDLALRVRRIFG